jgi:lysophospholipase L1-like esterase
MNMAIKILLSTLIVLLTGSVSIGADAPPEKIRIVAFGDSITRGFGATPYSVYLQQALNANSCNSVVINEGKDAETTLGGVERIGQVLAKHKPNYILIMEGANDARSGISSEVAVGNLGLMVDKSGNAGAKPIISAITPNTEAGGMENRLIPEDFNPKIQALANSRSIPYVDNYSVLAGPFWDEYTFDGLHMNERGQNILAQEFLKVLPCGGSSDSGGGGGGCFIATAAYGSLLEPHVALLRTFRDTYLLKHRPGQLFVDFYYRYSPPIADFIAQHDDIRALVRVFLLPLIVFAYLMINGYGPLLAAVLLSAATLVFWRKKIKLQVGRK